jgi:hypothetical protein
VRINVRDGIDLLVVVQIVVARHENRAHRTCGSRARRSIESQ